MTATRPAPARRRSPAARQTGAFHPGPGSASKRDSTPLKTIDPFPKTIDAFSETIDPFSKTIDGFASQIRHSARATHCHGLMIGSRLHSAGALLLSMGPSCGRIKPKPQTQRNHA